MSQGLGLYRGEDDFAASSCRWQKRTDLFVDLCDVLGFRAQGGSVTFSFHGLSKILGVQFHVHAVTVG